MPNNPATNLLALATGRKSARLTWVDGALNYSNEVYRSTANSFGSASFVAMVLQGVQIFIDEDLSEGTTYFWWVLARKADNTFASQTASATAATSGAAGMPGSNAVEQIVQSAESRLASLTASEFERLPFPRSIDKNADNIKFGYAALAKAGKPGADNQVLGFYCLDLELEIVFYQRVIKNNSELDIEQAELDLHGWADRIVKDFRKYRLFLPGVVLNIQDHSIAAPEYRQDMSAVVLRVTFPVLFRQSLNT